MAGEPGRGCGRARLWLGESQGMAGESQAVAGGELCCGWGSARLWAEVGWQGCQGVPGCQGVDFPLRRAGRGWGGLAGAGRGWQGLGCQNPGTPLSPLRLPPEAL